MTIEEAIAICRERNELDFLFELTKIIAETDSIGEGYNYRVEYTREHFNNAEKVALAPDIYPDDPKEYCQYLEKAGIEIYKFYLKQINVIQ